MHAVFSWEFRRLFIRTAWRSNWITQNDFTLMHQEGINTVRIPFEASMFTDPNEDGFKWLDQAVNWASQDNMYVVLDMHGAPGGQSSSEDTGQQNQDSFFPVRLISTKPRKCGGKLPNITRETQQ